MAPPLKSPRRSNRESPSLSPAPLSWPANTELLSLAFELEPKAADLLYPQYTVGLHAWFLDQIRQIDPDLSAHLHDSGSEKPFTLSGLTGPLLPRGQQLQLVPQQTYFWHLTALSQPVVRALATWLKRLPAAIALHSAPLTIRSCSLASPATTYAQLLQVQRPTPPTLTLNFLSPTSFRRKGHHLPLPWPPNVFHSYLRRWNDFSGLPFEQEEFLAWIDDCVLIQRHRLESSKVVAGKKGSVTGFTGFIEFGLSQAAAERPDFEQLFFSLGQLAPYCGTGHKTTFGLGQTRLERLPPADLPPLVPTQIFVAHRIEELTETFVAHRKRPGGDRAREAAQTWATILARRETGESLQTIAQDLEMPYETVKTYAKLARRALNHPEASTESSRA